MNKGFKITNMRFDYGNPEEPKVHVSWNANFSGEDNISGQTALTMEEFSGVTTGIAGYATLVKAKVTAGFEGLE